ncbi:CAP domain-containing protein [Kineosporia rhizophila]|uniref:CAP domain-containing protein n=1 Tax=Kineosporia rhizophila TaxID=84633 RepID=UPI001E49F891|nr:CAP domain-containing protein [Kineosporia rhizophila]MCE0536928.1 CAP domain-containing protein [Kineosporia rhizophila]
MSLTRHQKFRPLLIGAVTAVVVGGSGAAWACNGLLSNDTEAPRAQLATHAIELGAAATDSRPKSEARAERKKAQEERKKERRKKHRNHGHHRPGHGHGHGPIATTEPGETPEPGEITDPGETTSPEEPTTEPTTEPTGPTETTEPDETQTTEPTEPDETATTEPSDPGPTTPEEPTTEPTTDVPTTEPTTEAPTTTPDETTTSPSGDSTLATAVIKIVNTERAAAGCEPVTQDQALTQAALTHSEKMEAANQMSHQLPGEADLGTRFTAAGYTGWRSIGENVAYGYTSAASVMDGWMNSAGHKANILNCSFDDIGVAAVTGDNGTIWWTQTFGTQG